MLRLAPVLPLFLTAAAAEDPCKCLQWYPLYDPPLSESAQVWCGEGREFGRDDIDLEKAFFAEMSDHHGDARDICNLYKKMQDNYCVNSALNVYGKATEEEKRQWCYVSSECKDLNGGRKVSDKDSIPTFIPGWLYGQLFGENTLDVFRNYTSKYLHSPKVVQRKLAVKYCGAKDKRTRDMSVPEVVALAEKYDVRTDLMLKIAFAVARRPHHGGMEQFTPLWEDVRDYLGPDKQDQLPEVVAKAIKNKDAIVLDCDAHTMDNSVRVIHGKEIHKIDSPCEEFKTKGEHCPYKDSSKSFKYHKGSDIGTAAPAGTKKSKKASGSAEL